MSRQQQQFDFFDAVRSPSGSAGAGDRAVPAQAGIAPEHRDEVLRLMAACVRTVAQSICSARTSSNQGATPATPSTSKPTE